VPYRRFRRKLTASYLAPFIVAIGLLAATVLWRIQAQVSVATWVEHSDQVILRTKDAELEMRDMMLALQAYLLTDDKQFLTKLADTQRQLANELGRMFALVGDNPGQEQRLLQINDLNADWTRTADDLVRLREAGHFSANDLAAARHQVRAVFSALEDFVMAENRLRASRTAQQNRESQLAFILVPVLSVLVMIFLSYWGWRQIYSASEEFHSALTAADESAATAEEARRKAEKANLAKDQFLGTVSHELRNPLNSIILWSATLLAKVGHDASIRRGLEAIERAARAQAQLIEELLDISRIESGRLRLDVQTVDLAAVVHEGIESIRAAAEAKSIVLQEIIDPRVDFIAGDPGRLQQVVWNLVSNAVKFTPRGGKIQVRVERINSHVEIVVADTGQGIERGSLSSVFDRFWQADELHRGGEGVGLGLSIVKEIVNLHGGAVSAHSEGRDKGSTFTVRLPLPISKTLPSELRAHPVTALANTANAPRLDGATILVVDDDVGACDALTSLLGSLGASVTAVTSAQQALDRLETLHPDAIVSDIGMPVHDGYFLAGEVRKRELNSSGRQRVPLIALTAYGRVDDKVKMLNAGFDSLAVKPVEAAELSTVLQTLIAVHRDARR
jgi:signal transduction histidine kinase/ActR/RegA family two-component response regulator